MRVVRLKTVETVGGAYLVPVAPAFTGAELLALPENFTLADALACPAFEARDPAGLPGAPEELVDALRNATTILLVGHISPDADCVGSTLALARAMEDLGKRADVCVDDELSSPLRRVDDRNQVRRAADLAGRHWDLAIVMDTMVKKRLGGAIDLLANADTIGIVDHHQGQADSASLGIAEDKPFFLWSAPHLPAAALMSSALIGRFDASISKQRYAAIYEPALAGFATDVRFGELPNSNREDFRYFKFMAERAGLDMETLRERVTVQLPAAAAEIVASEDLVQRFDGGDVPLTVLTCPTELFDLVLQMAQLGDPTLNRQDLTVAFKDRRDRLLLEHGGLAAFVYEKGVHTVASFRSDGRGHAHRLAALLEGGGHLDSAAARVRGQTASEVVRWIASSVSSI